MLYFIVNPNSGGEKGFQIWKQAQRLLERQRIPYKVYVTDEPGDATRLARKICAEHPGDTIVPVGGDGTFNEVLNGLDMNAGMILGYIPTGSGNDLARSLGLKCNPRRALKTILTRKKILGLDYGVLTFGKEEIVNRRFAVSSGIGYDAQVCVTMARNSWKRQLSKIRLSKAAYITLGAVDMFRIKPSKGYLILDGEKRVEFNDIVFVSSQIHVTEGGGKVFAPTADFSDGQLTLCVIHTKSKANFVKLLFYAIRGAHLKYPGVRIYNCKSVKIHVDQALDVHTDGEIFPPQTDIELHCVERKLKMIV